MSKKDEIIRLLQEGVPYDQIAARLSCAKSTISYHAQRAGLGQPKGAVHKRYDWEKIQEYYDEGHTYIECARHFGFSLSRWHQAIKIGKIQSRGRNYALEVFLVSNRVTNMSDLKKRLMQEGLLENKCDICGISEWMGKELVLQMHHINGDHSDNRLENLQLLCPNCHSQTHNFNAKNKKSLRQEIPTELKCNVCNEIKPIDDFPVRNDLRVGRQKRCKDCSKKISQERRAKATIKHNI